MGTRPPHGRGQLPGLLKPARLGAENQKGPFKFPYKSPINPLQHPRCCGDPPSGVLGAFPGSAPRSPGTEMPPVPPSPISFPPALGSPLGDGVLSALVRACPPLPGKPGKGLSEFPCVDPGIWDLRPAGTPDSGYRGARGKG